MIVFKLIGYGAIVRRFVECFAGDYTGAAFEIYRRGSCVEPIDAENVRVLPIKDFQGGEGSTLLCCSVNEEEILRRNGGNTSRACVAQANMDLIQSFINQRFFDLGLVFVLTNPSEIVAQYIADSTSNSQIYSLGLSVDHQRYRTIFADQTDFAPAFSLAGNHWDRCFPVLCSGETILRQDLDKMYGQFMRSLSQSFDGFRPPIQSGAEAIKDLVDAFIQQTSLQLSSRDPANGHFIGGRFCVPSHRFIPTKITDDIGQRLLGEITGRHQSMIEALRT